MDEFLIQNYTLLTHSVEIIAALTGLFCYRKYKSTTTKYLIWFLVYIALMELIGAYPGYVAKYEFLEEAQAFLKGTRFEKNYWFFTIFWTVASTLFYGIYFKHALKKESFKKILKYLMLLFLAFSGVYLCLNWEMLFKGRPIPIEIFGVTIIILAVIFYLVELLRSDYILNLSKSMRFYIAITLILWYVIVTPLTFYNVYFNTADWHFVILKYQIHLFANLCMYLTFTFALLWCNPQIN